MNEQQEQRGRELEDAAVHWDALAAEQEKIAAEKNPRDCVEACRARAETYKRTAQALRKQIETGVAYCACCLKPLGASVSVSGRRR